MNYMMPLVSVIFPTHNRAIDAPLARFRIHATSKTSTISEQDWIEAERVSRRYWDRIGPVDEIRMKRYLAFNLVQIAESSLFHGDLKRCAFCLRETVRSSGVEVIYAVIVGSWRRLTRFLTGYPPKGSNALRKSVNSCL